MERKFLIERDQRVIFAGLVCVDIINVVQKFPTEDQGHRCLDCLWQRGGNASNSASVFSLLGGNAEFFGTLAGDENSRDMSSLKQDFEKLKVNIERCVVIPETFCPTSIVILSKESGTRTVLHTNKDLRELQLSDFQSQIDLSPGTVGWVHFEGRDNAEEIAKMINFINHYNETASPSRKITVSLEAEKLRLAPGLEKYDMWKLPDVMFVSKDFAMSQGYHDMRSAAEGFHGRVKSGAVLICAWGDEGAAAMSAETGLVTSPVFAPERVVDTCGAGDTFNAATINALSKGKGLEDAIRYGCQVAGFKCGVQGYGGIESFKM